MDFKIIQVLVLLLSACGYGLKNMYDTNTQLKQNLTQVKTELREVKEKHLFELDEQKKDYNVLLSVRDSLHQEHLIALRKERELRELLNGLEKRIQETPEETQDEINQEVQVLLNCYKDLSKC